MSCLALVPDSRFLPMYILLSRGFGSSDLVCAIGKGDSAGALSTTQPWLLWAFGRIVNRWEFSLACVFLCLLHK